MFLDLSILSCVNSIIGTRWLNVAELVPTLNSKDALNESVCLSPTGGQQLRLFLCIWVHCFEWNHEINQSLDPHNILSEAEVPEQISGMGAGGYAWLPHFCWVSLGWFVRAWAKFWWASPVASCRGLDKLSNMFLTPHIFWTFVVLRLCITSQWLNDVKWICHQWWALGEPGL